MTYPLVTDLAADGVPVAVTCRVLKFSKQGYYRWRASPVTERDWIDASLVNVALDTHFDDPAFWYRFIADEPPEKGITAGENRVQRLYCGRVGLDARAGDSEEFSFGLVRECLPTTGLVSQ